MSLIPPIGFGGLSPPLITLAPPLGVRPSAKKVTVKAFISGSAASTSGSTVTIPAPANISAGNLLVAVLYGANTSMTVFTGPAGWTRQSQSLPGNAAGEAAVFTKTATGSEPASYAFSAGSFMAGAILQFSGFTTVSSILFNPTNTATAQCSAPTQSGIPAGSGVIAAFGSQNGDTFTTPSQTTLGASSALAGSTSIFAFYNITAGNAFSFQSTQSGFSQYNGFSMQIA